MSYTLPTDTAHVQIESRQYSLLNFDLGEGVPRSTLMVGALIFAPWFVLMWVASVPIFPPGWLILWVLPPALVAMKCIHRDASGRVSLVGMLDAIAFRTQRHRHRIINGETARADRGQVVDAEFVVIDRSGPPS